MKDSLVGFGYKVTPVRLPSSIPTVKVKFKVIVLSHPAAFGNKSAVITITLKK